MGFRAQPVTIPARGTVPSIVVGLPMETGDALVIGNITITTSDASLTVDNEAVNVSPVTINGTTYAAGQAVEFDLISANDAPLADSSEYVRFVYTAPSGYEGRVDLQVAVVAATQADYTSTPAVSADGSTFYLGTRIWELLGVAENAADLGVLTQRDADYPTVPDNSSYAEAIQKLVTAVEVHGIDASKYGCDPTGVADSAPGLELAVAAANAWATSAGTLMRPETTGSSISRRPIPKVVLPPGKYNWDSVAELKYTDANTIDIEAWGAVIFQGDNFPTGRWLIEAGIPGSMGGSPNYTTYGAPFNVNIDGLTIRDYDRGLQLGVASNNINLGRITLRECTFIGKDDGTSLPLRVFNRSADFIATDCQWDNNRNCGEFQSIDRIYIERPRVQIREYQDAADRAALEAQFVVRRGHMYVEGGTFNPPQTMPEDVDTKPVGWLMGQEFPDWVTGTAYAFADIVYADNGSGEKLWVCKAPHEAPASFADDDDTYWAEIDQTGSGPLSVWCDITAEDCLFGGEGGGLVPGIWDIDAHDDDPGYPRGITIRNCTCNTNTQCGYESIEYAASTFVNTSPIVLVSKIPNRIEVRNIKGGLTYMVAADFLKGSTPPTLWVPTQTKPFQAIAENIEGTLFHNYSPSGGLLYKYSPTWMPQTLAVPLLQVNDVSPFWPANAKVAKTANTSATTISLFYGLNEGQEFTLYINDANTTIADGTYIKLNGSGNWTPGANGGAIRFVVLDGVAWEVGRADHA